MKPPITKSEDGVVRIVEFFIVFGVFLILFVLFLHALSNVYISNQNPYEDLNSKSIEITNLLIEDTGRLENGTREWELYPMAELNGSLARLGLAEKGSSHGLLSIRKLDALRDNVSYNVSKKAVGLENWQNLHVNIVQINNSEVILNYGIDLDKANALSSFRRIALLKKDNEYISVELTVNIFMT
jgi:hypothetical protein